MTAAWRMALRPALLLAGLLLAGLALRLLPAGGSAGLLSRAHGPAAAVELLVVGTALCAVGVPRQVVCYAAGLSLGGAAGAALALGAQVLACAADFLWARLVGRRWVAARLRGRLAQLDHGLSARPFATTLTLRLLPVGNNLLLNLAAGVSGVAARPFLAASALGYVPQTLVFALAGSGVRLGHGMQLVLAAGLFACSAALAVALWRRALSAAPRPAATSPR